MELTNKSKSLFLKIIGSSPRNKILDFLIENKRESWSLVEIRNNIEIGYSTLKVIMPKLLKEDLIKIDKKLGKIKLYSINQNNSIIKKLIGLRNEINISV